jgi:hypothetical protein
MVDKVEDLLSSIVDLEKYLDSRPGGVPELRRREKLQRCALAFPTRLLLTFFPASSTGSMDN